jgi:ABC-type bacteriocin/lantibiotic exporter with double-glycine peptidase domain
MAGLQGWQLTLIVAVVAVIVIAVVVTAVVIAAVNTRKTRRLIEQQQGQPLPEHASPWEGQQPR